MEGVGLTQASTVNVGLPFPNLKHLPGKSNHPFNIVLMGIDIYSVEGQQANGGSNQPNRELLVGIPRIAKDDDISSPGMAPKDFLICKGERESITELTSKQPIPYLQSRLHAGRRDMKTLDNEGYNDEIEEESSKDYFNPFS